MLDRVVKPFPARPAFVLSHTDSVLCSGRVLDTLLEAETCYPRPGPAPHPPPHHRKLLADWMLEVCQAHACSPQVTPGCND